MVLRLVSCVMVVAMSAAAVVTAHELSGESAAPAKEAFAERIMPLDAANDLRHARTDSVHSDSYLLRATKKDPWDSDSWIQLSVNAELRGDITSAASYLNEAVAHDAGAAPRWASANFYFRQGDRDQFLRWVNLYRERTHENEQGLLRMVAEVSPNPHDILAELPSMDCDELSSLLATLQARPEDTDEVVDRMANGCHDDASHKMLEHMVTDLLARDKPIAADHLWRKLGVGGNLDNSDFQQPISGEGFDWRINQNPSVQVKQIHKDGLQLNFDEGVADGTVLLFQPVSLNPGAGYRLNMNFDAEPAAPTAFRWELVELSTGRHVPSGLDKDNINELPSWRFEMPDSSRTVALALFYARPSGTVPFQGTVKIHAVQLARQLMPDMNPAHIERPRH